MLNNHKSNNIKINLRNLPPFESNIQAICGKREINIHKGVKQRDTLSPNIFSAAFQGLPDSVNWDGK